MLIEDYAAESLPTEKKVGATIQDVIDFIDARKEGTGLATWNKSQIGAWVWESIERQVIRVAFDQDEVIAVGVFEPAFPHGFLVDQIWSKNKLGMRLLVRVLAAEFPEVTQVWGWRVNCLVAFKLKTLQKIYGR